MRRTSVLGTLLVVALLVMGGVAFFSGDTKVGGGKKASAKPDTLVTLPAWDTGLPDLELPIPADYSTRPEKGPDFDVYFLEPESPSRATGFVYVGHSPNFLHAQLEPTGDVTEHGETIGGDSVRVYDFEVEGPDGSRFFREAILTTLFANQPDDKRLSELWVHIAVDAPTSAEADKLWAYVSKVHCRAN